MKRKRRRVFRKQDNGLITKIRLASNSIKNRHSNSAWALSFPQLILSILACYWMIILITKVDPRIIKDIPWGNSYGPALLLVLSASWIWIFVLTKKWMRSSIWSSTVVLILVFRLIGIGHIFNLGLIIGVAVAIDYYLSTTPTNSTP